MISETKLDSFFPSEKFIIKSYSHLSDWIDIKTGEVYYLTNVKTSDFYSSKYDDFIFLGVLNIVIYNSVLEQFFASYKLKSLIKEPACFESVDNPSCLDLILTNHPKRFQNSGVYETSISDFYKLTFTILKTYFQKAKLRMIKYRDCKHFDNNEFRDELIKELPFNNI